MNTTRNMPSHLFQIPLTPDSHQVAMEFAKLQPTALLEKDIYFSILSVIAVHDYLRWFGIDTDFVNADCWRPSQYLFSGVADLLVPGLGKVECCPVLPESNQIRIPIDAAEDRAGYVGVLFDESLDTVALLGFAPSDGLVTELQVADLQPMETIFDYIQQVDYMQQQETYHNLRQWSQAVAGSGWRSLEDLFNPTSDQIAYSVRNLSTQFIQGFNAGKLINLGIQVGHQVVLLLVGISLEADNRLKVAVRLCAGNAQESLPAGIRLILRSETGTVLSEVQEMIVTDYLQLLPFKADSGTRFSVQIQFDDATMTEYFVA